MPRGKLSKETRLQMQVTHLTKSVASLRAANKELYEELKLKNERTKEVRFKESKEGTTMVETIN